MPPKSAPASATSLERKARGEARSLDEFLVDLLFLNDAQAVGHLDHTNAIDEGLVVLVSLEALPLGFVGMRKITPVNGIAPIFSVPI